MSLQNLSVVSSITGEVIAEAKLDGKAMACMNFAREEHKKLETILKHLVIPAMGGYSNPVASDIARHLEQIRVFTSNYCWNHRHLGRSHDAMNVGGAQ